MEKIAWTLTYQRKFFDSVAKQLRIVPISSGPILQDITSLEDWYSLYNKQLKKKIIERGGAYIVRKYNSNIPKMLATIYPEHKWQITKFKKAPNYWSSTENQRAFLTESTKKFRILVAVISVYINMNQAIRRLVSNHNETFYRHS